MTLGERIRAAIDRKNMSHAWVAEEVGMTAAALSNILCGKTQDPSFFTVLAIARAIGEPVSTLVDDPLIIWTEDDLTRLRDMGKWLTERTTRGGAGAMLDIPSRRKRSGMTSRVVPVAAEAGGVLYPDAFELQRKRIPAKYKRAGANAVFSVRGVSMTGENIEPGDLLYVRRTSDVAQAVGRIVVCEVDDMLLVKRLESDGERLRLVSAHPEHRAMIVDEDSSRFELVGVVIGTASAR